MKPFLHNIEVSLHAWERIKFRLLTTDRKIPKLAQKAWEAPEVDSRKLKKARYKNYILYRDRICKELMGYIFVFRIIKKTDKKILITVF